MKIRVSCKGAKAEMKMPGKNIVLQEKDRKAG